MIGTRLGDYQLEGLLGRGGMGEVHRAYDNRRHRRVALKLLSEHLAHNREYRERFRRESHVAARLQEPHVIPIHDYGEIDGRLFIDMRLVNGTDLGKVLEQTGPLTPTRTVNIISQVAEALDAAHSDGLVHRDVKPTNVLITGSGDFVYLVDFGIAHVVENVRLSLTEKGVPLGTPDYMAPERFDDKPVDRRVDVYSLGCLLYECLTAERPFSGDSVPALMKAHLFDPPPQPSQLRPGIPAPLDEVVARALAKDPDERYATAGELAAAAREALAAGSTSTPGPARTTGATRLVDAAKTGFAEPVHRPRQPTGPVSPKRRGRPIALGLGAALLAAGAVVAVVIAYQATETTPPGTSSTAAPGTPDPVSPQPATSAPVNLPTSTRTAEEVFGAATRNGLCESNRKYQVTRNDIEALRCEDTTYVRYFFKYENLDPDQWVADISGGANPAYRNVTLANTYPCYKTYTAVVEGTDNQPANSVLRVFRRTPFVAEVVARPNDADFAELMTIESYTEDMAALC